MRFLAGRPGELMGAIRVDTGRLRQYPRQTRAAGSGEEISIYLGHAGTIDAVVQALAKRGVEIVGD